MLDSKVYGKVMNIGFPSFVERHIGPDSGELREMLQEVDRLYNIWDTVRDARCDYYYVTVRRQALKKLRETVGDDAYYSGALPPHVPIWRFARID